MMFFTDYIESFDNQYLIGWSMVACISFNALINIVIVLGFGGKSVYLICLKVYRILDNMHENWCLRMLRFFQRIGIVQNCP